jgi:hypothetical protein
MNISGGSKFVAGPLPKHSLSPPDAPYSGLLECPMTDKIEKILPGGNTGFNSTYSPKLFCAATDGGGGNSSNSSTSCEHAISSAEECFAAAQVAVGKGATVATSQGSSDSKASGCTVTYDGKGSAAAFFNTKQTEHCCGADVTSLKGEVASLVDLQMVVTNDNVTITLTGPDKVWFGVGWFAQAMEDKPYAVIVDGHGAVTERELASHMGTAASPAGSLLAASVQVVSSTVADGKRTVVLSRSAIGASMQHANFSLQDIEIPFITAIGSSPTLTCKLKTLSTPHHAACGQPRM